MIGYLKGEIFEVDGNEVIVMVGGVGYRVRTIQDSRFKIHESVGLYIHTHVKEDELSLYGFADKKALKMFELLIGVSGVGPKVAMNILGQRNSEKIQRAVATADVGFFTEVKGLGKKGAQKIIIELKNKLGDLQELDLGDVGGDELVAALVGMGFGRQDVVKVLSEMEVGLSEDEKIKIAIRKLGKK